MLLAASALVRRRPATLPPPVGARRLHPVIVGGMGLATMGALGGWWAFLVGGATLVATTLAVDRWVDRDVAAWVSGMLPAVAGLFYWWRPLGSADGWAGTLRRASAAGGGGARVVLAWSLDPRLASARLFQPHRRALDQPVEAPRTTSEADARA